MKKRKNEISKILNIFILPFILLCLVITVALAFAEPKGADANEENKNEIKAENERMVSVFFHNSGEIRSVPLEEYLISVVPAEMPPSFNEEALKAQAVAARTFIINRENIKNDEAHKGASICTDSNHCKAYVSETEAYEKWGEDWNTIYKAKIKKAVNDTRGEIITYMNEPISAVFHSTSSGKTENSEDVWQSALPYLRSVESEGEDKSPRYSSKETISLDEFKSIIEKNNFSAAFKDNKKEWIGKITYNESGSVKEIIIGGVPFKGTEVRQMFNLRSANFNIIIDENVTFNVKGNGHGVGMSQYGANHAAESGYTYDRILKKYYQGVEIEKI